MHICVLCLAMVWLLIPIYVYLAQLFSTVQQPIVFHNKRVSYTGNPRSILSLYCSDLGETPPPTLPGPRGSLCSPHTPRPHTLFLISGHCLALVMPLMLMHWQLILELGLEFGEGLHSRHGHVSLELQHGEGRSAKGTAQSKPDPGVRESEPRPHG